MNENKNPAIAEWVNRVIKNSWTFAKLTDQEKEDVLTRLAKLRSTAKTQRGVANAVDRVYSEFLKTVGYEPSGWR